MVKKLAAIVLVLLLLAGLAGGAAFYFLSKPKVADALTQYLGQQAASIANTYLVPDLAFRRVEYERPYTLKLFDATLTAPDDTEVLRVGTLVVTLAELPSRDKPIKIKEISIEDGALSLIRDPATGEIRGLVPMVERGVSADDESQVDENVRLSNVLVLERLNVKDMDLSVDLGDGNGPMVIEGFNADLGVQPAGDPGWYALNFTSGRAPGLELAVDGRFNIDTFVAEIATGDAHMTLEESTYKTLPGQLASALRNADAKGELEVDFSGTLPLTDPINASNITAKAVLTELNVAAGAYRLPIDRAVADVTLASGIANVPSFKADMIKGTLTADARATLSQAGMPTTLNWSATGLDVEDLLRNQEAADAPDLAGTVDGKGTASTQLANLLPSMSGSGEIHLRDGRVLVIPGITELAKVASVAGFGQNADKSHTADVTFTLTGQGVRLDSSEIVTNTMAARATGLIGYDSTLDLKANAGPLEKVQDLLGDVGGLIGQITDKVVTYTIKGPASDPKVGVAPLGIGG